MPLLGKQHDQRGLLVAQRHTAVEWATWDFRNQVLPTALLAFDLLDILENRDQLPHTTAVLPLNSRRLSEQSPTMMAASELKRPQWWWERELGAPRWVEGRLEFQDY